MYPLAALKDKDGGTFMKMITKVTALCILMAMLMSCFVGCGPQNSTTKGGNEASDVEISIWNAGNGTAWLEAAIEAFNAKQSEYHVYYRATADFSASYSAFGLADVDTTDLYLTSTLANDLKYLEPLDDVLNTTIPGESKTLKEKFPADYLASMEFADGHYYNLSSNQSIIGIVYNKELFQKAGITQLPRTSDELAVVCSKLYDEGITPLCHFLNGGYWWKMSEYWFAMHEGAESYHDFYHNPTKDKMLAKDGRYEALKALEKIVTPEYILSGSNVDNHISIQTKFMDGRAAMMVNGTWLSNEMGGAEDVNKFAMMPTPVISSIIDRLTTVKNDQQLRKVVSAVDACVNGEKTEADYKQGDNFVIDGLTISAEDWTAVRVARTSVYSDTMTTGFFIPNYSNATEGAKEFLKFFYSDECTKILAAKHYCPIVSLTEGELDLSNWNEFEKSVLALRDQAEGIITPRGTMKTHRLFTDGGAWPFGLDSYAYATLMCTKNENDRVGADEAWDYIYKVINDSYENWEKNIKN